MLRGELWWADLGLPRGSAPALRRPVLIISADQYNRSNLQRLGNRWAPATSRHLAARTFVRSISRSTVSTRRCAKRQRADTGNANF